SGECRSQRTLTARMEDRPPQRLTDVGERAVEEEFDRVEVRENQFVRLVPVPGESVRCRLQGTLAVSAAFALPVVGGLAGERQGPLVAFHVEVDELSEAGDGAPAPGLGIGGLQRAAGPEHEAGWLVL